MKLQAVQTPVKEPTVQEAANAVRTNLDIRDPSNFTSDIIEREKKYGL